jgi:hypothetical protein
MKSVLSANAHIVLILSLPSEEQIYIQLLFASSKALTNLKK